MTDTFAVREDLRPVRREAGALKNVYGEMRTNVTDMRMNVSAIKDDVAEVKVMLAEHSVRLDSLMAAVDRCNREVNDALAKAGAGGLLDRASALRKGREIAAQHGW